MDDDTAAQEPGAPGSAPPPSPALPASSPPAPPPPVSAPPPQAYAPPGYGAKPPPPPYGAPASAVPAYGYDGPRTEGLAVAALVVAIVGVFVCGVLAGIVALVLASQAQQRIAASNGRLTGAGMVTAARVVAIVAIAFERRLHHRLHRDELAVTHHRVPGSV